MGKVKTEVISQEEEAALNSISELFKANPIQQQNDLTGVLTNLNEDKLESDGLSSIDTKTRLHPFELQNVIVHDALIGLGCLPQRCSITTRLKKRLAVSLLGKGRDEVVRIVQGEREKEKGGGFMEGVCLCYRCYTKSQRLFLKTLKLAL